MDELANLESIENEIMPLMIKGLFVVGIAVTLSGIVIAIGNLIMKESRKEIGRRLLYTMGIGLLIIASGAITCVLFRYEPNFSDEGQPIIIAILIFVLIYSVFNSVLYTLKQDREKDIRS